MRTVLTNPAAPDRQVPGPDRPALEVRDLKVTFTRGGRQVQAAKGVSFDVRPGRMLAIIGESGSGKSVTVRALMGLLPPSARVSGSARLGDTELVGMGEKQLRRIRGREVSMVFQDPARSLNPTMSVGAQIVEAVRTHQPMGRREAAERAVELLRMVRLPAPEKRFHQYPHQLSGGMRQRVMIAIALASDPKVLIADEATTALDVTTQAQIMELLVDLQGRLGTAVVMISHDLGLAASYADEVVVMYAGRIVEQADTAELFSRVRMPYTRALLDAIPQVALPSHTPLAVIGGHPPDPGRPVAGCPFRPRCPRATEACLEAPALTEHEPGHRYACWHPMGGGGGGGPLTGGMPVDTPRPDPLEVAAGKDGR
ncbi:ABC transporter ATP-binding protein [Citricoccus sp. SGAir0253]|uniref:ABC transporter ATP-binding protein n=1 Tax=Citricoccus sp. SGAir0253 TaxID=2567881 RepID=UPI0010CD3DFA|nr:ABC transporter ATP-binding protein [Citricoccus sp. SGAir0253]QCU78879.1 ABC transporter ATP-binding protein [Citricoccus sp. SGAir0253]